LVVAPRGPSLDIRDLSGPMWERLVDMVFGKRG